MHKTMQRTYFQNLFGCSALLLSALLVAMPAHAQPPRLMEAAGIPAVTDEPRRAKSGRSRVTKFSNASLRQASFQIDLVDETVRIMRDRVEQDGDRYTTWVGHIEFEETTSEVVLTRVKHRLAGKIIRGDRLYEVSSTRSGKPVIFEVDTEISQHDEVVQPSAASLGDARLASKNTIPMPAAADSPVVIDLMMLYTAASCEEYGRDADGGCSAVEAAIISAVADTNVAYTNSNVNTRMNMVHLAEVDYVEDTTDEYSFFKTLNALSDLDGEIDYIHQWRDQYGADLVSLVSITNRPFICGLARGMPQHSGSMDKFAFSTVSVDCLSNKTLAHELGHNMGAQHDRESATNLPATPYGYGYRDCGAGGFSTVMAYGCNGMPRVSFFSSPQVQMDNGRLAGTPNEDVARTFALTSPIVAQYRSSVANPDETDPNTVHAPINVRVSNVTTRSALLQWNYATTGVTATGADIYVSEDNSGWRYLRSVSSQGQSLALNSLNPATPYRYLVKAINGNKESGFSDIVSFTTDLDSYAPAPNAPTNLVATGLSPTSIAITWQDRSDNENTFQINQLRVGGSWRVVASLPANTTNYVATGLDSSSTYSYQVRAKNAGGPSDWSNPDYATPGDAPTPVTPAPPTNLTVTLATITSTALSWSDQSSNESGFTVQRREGSGNWTTISNSSPDTSSLIDGPLKSNTVYGYRLRAWNDVGVSSWSPTETVRTPVEETTPGPVPPSDLSVSILSSSSLRLNWTDRSADESAFQVLRNGTDGVWKIIATLGASTTSMIDNGLSAGTTYAYRVRAINNTGSSLWSNTAAGTTETGGVTPSAAPKTPTDFRYRYRKSEKNGSSFLLKWRRASRDTEGYMIYRDGALIATLAADAWRYRDTGSITPGSIYYYEVHAFNSVGTSTATALRAYAQTGSRYGILTVRENLRNGVPVNVLVWSGMGSDNVTVYRNGQRFSKTRNDGRFVTPARSGRTEFQICNISKSRCTNVAGVTTN